MNTNKWLNWQQACKLMDCSRSQFYRLVNEGKIFSKRSGKTKGIKVLKADCEKWLYNWQERGQKPDFNDK